MFIFCDSKKIIFQLIFQKLEKASKFVSTRRDFCPVGKTQIEIFRRVVLNQTAQKSGQKNHLLQPKNESEMVLEILNSRLDLIGPINKNVNNKLIY